jgi:uncharacterized membrane protein
MKTVIVSYLISLLSLFVIDGIWLATMSKSFYGKNLGALMSSTPQLLPALLFYLIYVAAAVVLVVLPAINNNTGLLTVFLTGALLGLAAYGTYDLTNQATIKDWPLVVTIVDLAWGSTLTGVVSVLAVYLTKLIK